jgi:hypothetical protein
MRLPLLQSPAAARSVSWGPAWIGIGLGLLVANACSPAVPVVTAMALVALGAIGVTMNRFRGTRHGNPLVAINLLVYFCLYALFIGASLHPLNLRSERHLDRLQWIDLAASIAPMAIALDRAWRAFYRSESAE